MEKKTEEFLTKLLNESNIKSNIYYTPTANQDLKEYFKKCSKNNTGNLGFPDRIYYDNETLIIFECKKGNNIKKAFIDLEKYKNKLEINKKLNIYYVAVAENLYKIYDENLKVIEKPFKKKTFKLENKLNLSDIKYNIKEMKKAIKKIHNYIHKNTKISDEDKPFFICCILISLKKPIFHEIIEKYDDNKYVYDIIKENLKDFDIDFNTFEFLRTDNNNKHFLELIRLIKDVIKKNKDDKDILNLFYNEFIKYKNTDSKSLGIVLTPEHIIQYMNNLLEINSDDIFLDLCTGTGSFIIDALKRNPKKIIGIEYQQKLFALLKCNMILRDLNFEKNDIIKDDCFNRNYNATKSAINPPFAQNTSEIQFILKQIKSLDKDSLCTAIVPTSCFSNIQKDRNLLLENCQVLHLALCNNQLFHGKAGVQTAIILLKKTMKEHDYSKDVIFEDITNDGYEVKRNNGRIKVNEPKYKRYNIKIHKEDETWIKQKQNKQIISKNMLKLKQLEIEYLKNKKEIETMEDKEIEIQNYKNFKIGDLFKILSKPEKEYKEIQYVNEISAKKVNNGVANIVLSNNKTFTKNKIVLVTGGDGGAGLAYYQASDFMIISSTKVLEPIEKKIKLNEKNGIYIALLLSNYKKTYSRGFQWNNKRIKNDIITLPITKEGEIDYKFIENQFEDGNNEVKIEEI